MKKISRRSFLTCAAAGIAMAGLPHAAAHPLLLPRHLPLLPPRPLPAPRPSIPLPAARL